MKRLLASRSRSAEYGAAQSSSDCLANVEITVSIARSKFLSSSSLALPAVAEFQIAVPDVARPSDLGPDVVAEVSRQVQNQVGDAIAVWVWECPELLGGQWRGELVDLRLDHAEIVPETGLNYIEAGHQSALRIN